MKKFLILTLGIILGVTCQVISQKLSNKIKVENTGLKKGLNYSAFTSNDDYIAWVEFYTRQIYIYNLEKNKIEISIQQKGRGPHEYIMISSLALTDDNKLIITDPTNVKLIIYNIDTKNYEEDVKLKDIRPYRVTSLTDFIFITSIPIKFKSLYNTFNLDSRELNSIDMSSLGENEFSYPFKGEGYITANDRFGIHLTRYYPHIFVIDFQKKQVKKKVFDEVTVDKGRETMINGTKAFKPPGNIKLLNKDIAFIPNKDSSVIILNEGKGKLQKYDPGQLQVYNFIEEKFTATISLGITGSELTVNNNYLFVYSEKENEIFQYEFIYSE